MFNIAESSKEIIPKCSAPLGCPIPFDSHAVSVSLPLWSHVVGYEEGDALVCNQLAIGYPRFKIHIYHEIITQKLMDDYEDDDGHTTCMVFPTEPIAMRCVKFLTHGQNTEKVATKRIVSTDFFAVYFHVSLKGKAKSFWQHAGEIMSSRQCSAALRALGIVAPPLWFNGQAVSPLCPADETLKELSKANMTHPEILSKYYNIIKTRILTTILDSEVGRSSVLPSISTDKMNSTITITTSGMAAIFSTLRLFQRYHGEGIVIVFGFPYLDTLKIMQRLEWNRDGCVFLGHGDESDYEELVRILVLHNGTSNEFNERPRIKALFTEFPSNPLLKCPDIGRIMRLAEEFNFLVAVDDTISSFANVDLISGPGKVDVLCTSLTKIFSGVGNVLAGGIIINPLSKHSKGLCDVISAGVLEIASISYEDAVTLEHNSRDFVHRAYQCSANALELARRLKNDHRVKQIYYPGLRNDNLPDPIYQSYLRNPQSGYGCLLSILLKDPSKVPSFFDNINISKGPSLGTNFTLACPYTLLAHYQELDWAAKYDVDKYIVRVSVGLEDIEDLWNRFSFALDVAHS